MTFGAIAIAGGAGGAVGGLALAPLAGSMDEIVEGNRFVAAVAKGYSGNDYVLPTLIEAGSEEFNSLECKEIASKS